MVIQNIVMEKKQSPFKIKRFLFAPGDKVWKAQHSPYHGPDRTKTLHAGVIKEAVLLCKVELLESARRICLRLEKDGKKIDKKDVVIGWKGADLYVTGPDGQFSADDIRTKSEIVPAGSIFNMVDTTGDIQVGDVVNYSIADLSFNVGVELADAINGWYWLIDRPTLSARVNTATPAYTILAQHHDNVPSIEEIDKELAGEKYPGITENYITIRQ